MECSTDDKNEQTELKLNNKIMAKDTSDDSSKLLTSSNLYTIDCKKHQISKHKSLFFLI